MPPNRTDANNPEDWFFSAADRLKIADLAWKNEGLTHSGIELLQEAVERYLKGYLIAKGWRLIRTHDLENLISEAQQFDKRFCAFIDLAANLTEDFFAQHYPGGDLANFGENYEKLRNDTGQMIDLIRELLPKYFGG